VLLSPVIDLSGVTLPPGETLDLSWKQAWHIESASYDHGFAAISINGGAFVDMWSHTGGTLNQPWTDLAYDISSAVGGNIQLRWTLTSDSSLNYAGLYVDKVEIGYGEDLIIQPPDATCSMIPGGVVAGYVYDNNTDEVLVGADVSSPTVETATFELEGDPDNAGLYWVFQPLDLTVYHIYLPIIMKGGTAGLINASAGAHIQGYISDIEFTASKNSYASSTETVPVESDAITQQDFYLDAGMLSFYPLEL